MGVIVHELPPMLQDMDKAFDALKLVVAFQIDCSSEHMISMSQWRQSNYYSKPILKTCY